jgi:hypothetical protein
MLSGMLLRTTPEASHSSFNAFRAAERFTGAFAGALSATGAALFVGASVKLMLGCDLPLAGPGVGTQPLICPFTNTTPEVPVAVGRPSVQGFFGRLVAVGPTVQKATVTHNRFDNALIHDAARSDNAP